VAGCSLPGDHILVWRENDHKRYSINVGIIRKIEEMKGEKSCGM
jgi:hypothetical protein